jgi:hypothetical protein
MTHRGVTPTSWPVKATGTQEVLAAQRTLGLDLKQVNDSDSPELPIPTVLIVDADRMVIVDTHTDYTSRTEVSDVIDALGALPDSACLTPSRGH